MRKGKGKNSRPASWQLALIVSLALLSALLYLFHYALFKDLHHILIYLVGDLAFLPLEVLLVTLIIHRLLADRERRQRMEKLNLVIGAFFSEVGSFLLTYLSDFDPHLESIRQDLTLTQEWSAAQFARASRRLRQYHYTVQMEKVDLKELKAYLLQKRDFLLRLLENPNLLEHEDFTELLQAVFHLTEELSFRQDLGALPDSDRSHLGLDTKRAYGLLVREWLDYMRHLKEHHPYLFSLALRTNPFDQTASPIVR
jgi:hypothetical protein